MATAAELFATAVRHHEEGRLPAAEQCYQQVLAIAPDHAHALHLLGVVLLQTGKHDLAARCISRAIELNGAEPAFYSNLGNALSAQGKLDEAIRAYQRALELQADVPEVHINLGAAFQAQGKPVEAVVCYRRAIERNPNHVVAHSNLGTALNDQGKLDDALSAYRRALELKPDDAKVHNNLGNTYHALGNLNEAAQSYRRALELQPDFAVAHNNLGNLFQVQGKLSDAIECHQRALELRADFAAAHNSLGNALRSQGKLSEACESYRRAANLRPDLASSHCHLAHVLNDQGKLDDAIAAYHRAVNLEPDYAIAHFHLGNSLSCQGKLDEGIASYCRALELKPDYVDAYDHVLLALQYQTGVTLRDLLEAHTEYDRRYAAPLRRFWRLHENKRDLQRPLRLGFVSPNFCQHAVGHFLVRVLENFDPAECEIVCYCDRKFNDHLTTRFAAAAKNWREVSTLSDQELFEMVQADSIDILFDLAGHTVKNRLLVFARRPAPIQVTWADYVGTTGLKAMDYILADRFEIPPKAEAHYTERVLRMPDDYVCYDPPSYAPDVVPLPALQSGLVTFGCFSFRPKISSQIIEVWAKILDRVPHSRLVLKYKGMNDDSIVHGLASKFAGLGINPQRIACHGGSPHARFLAEYGLIDLALDTFPYNGGLTTCEALWMGVPVVTCPGETFASRHSLSHLSNVGFTETIARDLEDYVELATALARDLPRLAALRRGLRARVAASPLCDGKKFAANLMRILRDVWCQWCQSDTEQLQ